MITDTIDLEQLLTQYEPKAVFVGPILSLSINASYRYLYIAGNGSKVYHSIGLGFVENELDAQKQRADIIEKLKPRFAELVTFGSHTEMARTVNARWRTEETARVLAAAEREATAASAPPADSETINEICDEHTLRGEQCERLPGPELLEDHHSAPLAKKARPTDGASMAGEQRSFEHTHGGQLAQEPGAAPKRTKAPAEEDLKSHSHQNGLTFDGQFRKLAGALVDDSPGKPDQADEAAPSDMMAKLLGCAEPSSNHEPTKVAVRDAGNESGLSKGHNHIIGKLTRERFEDTGRDQERSMRLPSAANLPPLTKECGEVSARRQRRDFGLTQDGIASAILKLASPTQPDICPIPPVESSRSLSESQTIVAAEPTPSHSEGVPIVPVKHARGRSTVLRLAASVAAIVLFSTFVVSSTLHDENEANKPLPAKVTNLPSKSVAAVASLPVSLPADARGSGQQIEAAPGAVPPPAAATRSQVENSGGNAAPVSDQHEPSSQQAKTADLSEAKEIAKLVNRGMESLKGGDLESARQLLQRAVRAIPSPAAVPSQVEPSRAISLRNTSQTSALKQPGLQNEHPTPIKSSSDAGQPEQTEGLEPRGAPVGGQMAPADSTIRHLEPDEIATLLSRGMDFLKSGDFASARVSLRRAAEAGNPEAALALGSTYDPSVLRELGAVAITADSAQARQWYRKAADFGSAAAAQRLARLAQTGR
jgi:hypothetical protein